MKVIYRVINKSDNKVMQYRNLHDVESFLLGRRGNNYIIIQSFDDVDQIITL